MAAENSKDRFADAVKLLNYGFGKCQLYTDESTEGISPVTVENGVEDTIDAVRAESFSYLDTSGGNINGIERSVQLNTPISAPVSKGDVLGYIVYTLDGKEIGKSGIIAGEDMKKATYLDHLGDMVREVFL